MSECKIITNGHLRDIIYGWELTEKEREEFDWIDSSDTLSWDDVEFFRYKGELYCLSDFMRLDRHPDSAFRAWDGYQSDSFFSGILVKYPKEEWGDYDTERVIVGWYIC